MKSSFKLLSTTLSLVVAVGFTACGSNDGANGNIPNAPLGLGYEQSVNLPNVNYPLPVEENIANNSDGTKKYSINDNPIAAILKGLNNVWKETTDAYQNAASGSGPSTDDYVLGNPIIDAQTWKENIQYVVDATLNRTDNQAILAFLDDRRGKNYSVADGFGPLTEDFVANSGAYVDFAAPTKAQVLEDAHYASGVNDGFEYGGDENSTLGAIVRLVNDFRNNNASASGTKYLFSSPRPWRMDGDGVIDFLGTDQNYTCTDSEGVSTQYTYDLYNSDVKVVPGLMCARRAHSSSDEAKELYTSTTDGRRKDGGYPSGHTNAGVLASLAYAYAFPERFSEIIARGAQLGESRIVAGMHSPVDVIGGRIMALAIAASALSQDAIASDAQAAITQAKTFFGAKADAAGMSLYDYAHQTVANPSGYTIGDKINLEVFNNNFYDDLKAMKELYRFRLTYGLPQNPLDAGQEPIVPKGAELLLQSRLPYLSAEQRRAVIATTQIDSGYPILDESNGWGRIDLLSAADGYGSFDGDVHLVMDAALGGYSANDSWDNDIDGKGMLTKSGSGALTLTGNNTYQGGTILEEGTLEASSTTALGTGELYIKDGTMIISDRLEIAQKVTQIKGVLQMNMSSANNSHLIVADTMTITGGDLVLKFTEGYTPNIGDTIEIISAQTLDGNFEHVSALGYSVEATYNDNKVLVKIKNVL